MIGDDITYVSVLIKEIVSMAELYSTTMYQVGAKGETRVWHIRVNVNEDNPVHATITRSHGVLDGKMNEVMRVIEKVHSVLF